MDARLTAPPPPVPSLPPPPPFQDFIPSRPATPRGGLPEANAARLLHPEAPSHAPSYGPITSFVWDSSTPDMRNPYGPLRPNQPEVHEEIQTRAALSTLHQQHPDPERPTIIAPQPIPISQLLSHPTWQSRFVNSSSQLYPPARYPYSPLATIFHTSPGSSSNGAGPSSMISRDDVEAPSPPLPSLTTIAATTPEHIPTPPPAMPSTSEGARLEEAQITDAAAYLGGQEAETLMSAISAFDVSHELPGSSLDPQPTLPTSLEPEIEIEVNDSPLSSPPDERREQQPSSAEDNDLAQLLYALRTSNAPITRSRKILGDGPDERLLPPPKRRRVNTPKPTADIKSAQAAPSLKAKSKAKPKAKASVKKKAKVSPVAIEAVEEEEEEEVIRLPPKHTYTRRRPVPSPPRVRFAEEDAIHEFDSLSPIEPTSPTQSGSSSPLSPPESLPSAFRRITRLKLGPSANGSGLDILRPHSPKRARVTRTTTARAGSLPSKKGTATRSARPPVEAPESSDESDNPVERGPYEEKVQCILRRQAVDEAAERDRRWREAMEVFALHPFENTTSETRSTLRPEDRSLLAIQDDDDVVRQRQKDASMLKALIIHADRHNNKSVWRTTCQSS